MLILAQAAQALDPRDSFEAGLMLMAVGMLVVFVSLIVIGELTALLGRLMRERPDLADVTPEPVRESEGFPTPPAATMNEMNPRTLAIIAAAVATTVGLGAQVRVRRVTRVAAPGAGGSAWTEAGRIGLQTSHNVRR